MRLNVLAAVMLLATPLAARADGSISEKVATYAIEGGTGVELYMSIGERGPKVGSMRAIAHTTFDLKWSRRYEPRGKACVLASAKPWLTVTYTVPKPATKLSAAVRARWDRFAAGVLAHEKVHGDGIKAMVREIEGFSVGFTVENDPDCRKIRTELTKRLAAASEAQRRQGRDFDREEFRDGGNMHRLILALVNGR
jgi:predicted secreted Zn-dependent protease